MEKDIYDVIIVGSGIGGLSAAVKASKEKAKTLILEAMPFTGGYINPYKVGNFSFDTGLHYMGELGENGLLTQRLQNLGVYERLKFIEINPDCIGKYHFGSMIFCLPKGINNFKNRIIKMFPEEKESVEKLICLIKDIQKTAIIGSKGPKHPDFIKFIPRFMKFMKKPYGKMIDEITTNSKLKYIFSIMSGEAGLPPDRASAFTATILLHYLEGGYYPQGGSGALKDAFVKTIKENKGEIKTLHKVNKISKENGLFKVSTNKGDFYSTNVISNADPTITFTKLLDNKLNIASLKNKAEHTESSMGAFYAFLITDLKLENMGFGDSNLIHSDTYDFNEAFEKWDEFKSFFITVPTLKDPRGNHAPEGLHAIEIITMAPFEPFKQWSEQPSRKRGADYLALKNKLGNTLLKKVEQYIPELRKHLLFKEFATPLSNLYWVNAPNGGCYGPNQTPKQMGSKRFSIKTKIKGLYLCGAGTIAGGIAPSITSGEIAATMALKN